MTAAKILSEAGLKCTKQRKAVIGTLSRADRPLSAEEIYERSQNAARSTIYRTIERLLDKRVITSTTIPQSGGVFYELAGNEHRHYAVCLSCGKMKNIEACPLRETPLNGFTITAHKIELYGYCSDCLEKIPRPV